MKNNPFVKGLAMLLVLAMAVGLEGFVAGYNNYYLTPMLYLQNEPKFVTLQLYLNQIRSLSPRRAVRISTALLRFWACCFWSLSTAVCRTPSLKEFLPAV